MIINIDTYSDSFAFGHTLDFDGQAVYLVAFARDDGQDAHYWGGNPADHLGGIGQLRNELQEAFDQGHIAGQFNIVGRIFQDEFVLSEDAIAAAGPWKIRVTAEDGQDITQSIATSHSVDGGHENRPIGRLDKLREEEARVCLAQIIDQGREHGPTDDMAELLYKQIDVVIGQGGGFIATPDGWLIKAVKIEDPS